MKLKDEKAMKKLKEQLYCAIVYVDCYETKDADFREYFDLATISTNLAATRNRARQRTLANGHDTVKRIVRITVTEEETAG